MFWFSRNGHCTIYKIFCYEIASRTNRAQEFSGRFGSSDRHRAAHLRTTEATPAHRAHGNHMGFPTRRCYRCHSRYRESWHEGYETFGEYLDAWELKGGFKPVLDSAHL